MHNGNRERREEKKVLIITGCNNVFVPGRKETKEREKW